MPLDPSIKSVLVIGSGPIVIGQACEFDYSGTQACRVLRAEGIRVILVNSNPATIMTDPEFADATYIEPITQEFIEQIIDIQHSFLQLSSRDASVFVYKKTIYEINNEYRKSIDAVSTKKDVKFELLNSRIIFLQMNTF